MSNIVETNKGGAIANYAGGADPFASAANDLGSVNASYLKFNGNTGDYIFGADDDELEHGERVVVDMEQAARGWICWKDGEVQEEINVLVIDGKPPTENQLTDHGPYEEDGDGWSEQIRLIFMMNDGTVLDYKASSKSGKRAFSGLLRDFAKQYKSHPGQLAVVEIDATSFMPKDKKIGKKYAPRFKIVDWISREAFEEQVGEDSGDYEDGFDDESGDEIPANKPAPTPAPAPEPTPEPAAEPAPAPEPAPAAETAEASAETPRRGRRGKRSF